MSLRATIACPEALIDDANQLALCLGLGPEDAATYGAADWLDAAGNRYAVASAVVSHRFAALAGSALIPPPWGADMEAAARAQGVIRIGTTRHEKADPTALVAILGDAPRAALDRLGLQRQPAGPI